MRAPALLAAPLFVLLSLLAACGPSDDSAAEGLAADELGADVLVDDPAGDPLVAESPVSSNAWPLATTAAAADAIFSGTVTAVDQRLAERNAAGVRVPFTFVTIQVEHAVKGAVEGEPVTLRLLGGRGEDGGLLYNAEGTVFEVGHRCILFVSGNGESGYPLVGGGQGRLRVVDGRVYDNGGAALRLDPRDGLVRGGWERLDEVLDAQVDGTPLLLHADDRVDSNNDEDAAELGTMLRFLDGQVGDAQAPLIQSLDRDAAFTFSFSMKPDAR